MSITTVTLSITVQPWTADDIEFGACDPAAADTVIRELCVHDAADELIGQCITEVDRADYGVEVAYLDALEPRQLFDADGTEELVSARVEGDPAAVDIVLTQVAAGTVDPCWCELDVDPNAANAAPLLYVWASEVIDLADSRPGAAPDTARRVLAASGVSARPDSTLDSAPDWVSTILDVCGDRDAELLLFSVARAVEAVGPYYSSPARVYSGARWGISAPRCATPTVDRILVQYPADEGSALELAIVAVANAVDSATSEDTLTVHGVSVDYEEALALAALVNLVRLFHGDVDADARTLFDDTSAVDRALDVLLAIGDTLAAVAVLTSPRV